MTNQAVAVESAKNDLGYDAWGRPKSITDRSVLHGMFSFNVPVSTWYETINGTIQSPMVNSTSVDGALEIVAGATLNDVTYLRTFRNPRYQPNRGTLYSTAGFLVNPDAAMRRSWGCFNAEHGVFFRLDRGVLYGVTRTITTAGGVTENSVKLDIAGVDLSRGNVYDIQHQWRGVGDYRFFINLDDVGGLDNLGNLDKLSMSNPAAPIAFESENLGDNDLMRFGCVDVTSEGGDDNGKTYGSVSVDNQAGQVAITGFNQPVIAIRSKLTVGGLINTRDTLSLLATGYTDQRAMMRIWQTRDFTAITANDQTWKDFGDGHLEYIIFDEPNVTTPMTFDTAKASLIFGTRVNQDQSESTSALFEGRTDIWQTPGDMFVFTMHRETGAACNVGITYEFAEEI